MKCPLCGTVTSERRLDEHLMNLHFETQAGQAASARYLHVYPQPVKEPSRREENMAALQQLKQHMGWG